MVVSTVRAGFAGGWQMSSIGLQPTLYGLATPGEIVGGDTVTGTVTLLDRRPRAASP